MKINFNFFKKKEPDKEVYLGIFLKELEGIILYITLEKGTFIVKEKEKFIYTNGWEHLAEDVDEVLYKLETRTKLSPNKTIFFVYSNLVDNLNREIKKPHLTKIRDMVKNLELEPLGYIECHEAIAETLSIKEQIPLNAAIIELDKSALSVFIYKGGKLIFKDTTSRTVDIVEDLLPIFEKVKEQTILPTRVILYNSKNLDVESTNILTFKWDKQLFIQLPKVETIKEDQLIENLIEVFSNQILPKRELLSEEKQPHEVMGFVIGGDVEKKQPVEEQEELVFEKPISKRKYFSFNVGAVLSTIQTNWSKIKIFFSSLKKSLPSYSFPVAGVVLILLSLFLNEYYFHKAKIVVFFPSQDITKDLSIEAAIKDDATVDDLIVLAATDSASFDDLKQTTGTKSIGEKAKGQVTVLNYNNSDKTFDKGTVISFQGIKFFLEDSVKVASASVASDLSLQPGKSNISAIASDIGPESNLSKNQRFQVDDFPTTQYLAVNSSDLTGGTKKEVRIVSKDDVDSLAKDILAKADKYNNNEIEKKLRSGFKLIKQLSDIKISNQDFSKKIGEEADSVNLKSNVKITYFYYQDKELIMRLISLLKPDIKNDFRLTQERTKYDIKDTKTEKNNKYLLEISAKAKATGDIKRDEILKTIIAKTSNDAEKNVKEKFQATGLEFQIENPIPFLKNRFPFFKKNIDFEVSFL